LAPQVSWPIGGEILADLARHQIRYAARQELAQLAQGAAGRHQHELVELLVLERRVQRMGKLEREAMLLDLLVVVRRLERAAAIAAGAGRRPAGLVGAQLAPGRPALRPYHVDLVARPQRPAVLRRVEEARPGAVGNHDQGPLVVLLGRPQQYFGPAGRERGTFSSGLHRTETPHRAVSFPAAARRTGRSRASFASLVSTTRAHRVAPKVMISSLKS